MGFRFIRIASGSGSLVSLDCRFERSLTRQDVATTRFESGSAATAFSSRRRSSIRVAARGMQGSEAIQLGLFIPRSIWKPSGARVLVRAAISGEGDEAQIASPLL